MPDLEKVIKGLACCTTIGEDGFPICDECPYFCDESCPNLDEMHKDALELLKEREPTVDAVPVRHGLWTMHEEGFSHEECGYFVDDNFFTPYHREKVNSWKYCPRCGAKMDGERRENG